MTVIILLATIITTVAVTVVVTAVVSVAVKNQVVQYQLRQLQYWQTRAMRAEDPQWRRP